MVYRREIQVLGQPLVITPTTVALLPSTAKDGSICPVTDDPANPVYVRKGGVWVPLGAGGGGSGSGWIYVEDVTGTVVSARVYQDNGNTVLQSCTVDSTSVSIAVRASYPLVTVNGVSATLSRTANGYYAGSVATTLVGSPVSVAAIVKTPDGSDGATDHISITVDAPPQILTLSFTGGYPGSQTELKAGDTYQVTGTTDKPAVGVQISNFGAGAGQTLSFSSNTTFTVTINIADRGTSLQALAARVAARNVAGAYGPTRDTNTLGGTTDGVDLVNLNNLYPTVTFGTITYPALQGALKNSETATVAVTTANLDSIVYDSPNGDLSVTNPNTDETPKTVTRIAGSYNVSTNNLRGTATRNANAAQTISQIVVFIANVAASVSVAPPAARLRSGGNDGTAAQNHSITITSDQRLYSAPTLDNGVGGGTWQGAGFVGGPSVWTRALQVHDNDTKGTYSWSNLVATNLAAIVTTSITGSTSYVLGGFVSRSLTFAAFSQTTTMNVAVVTYTKLQAGIFTATNQPALRNATQGDHSNIVNTYTVDSISTNPTTLFWNDAAAAASNSSGTAQITVVQETI